MTYVDCICELGDPDPWQCPVHGDGHHRPDCPTTVAEAVEAAARAITDSMRGRTWLSRSPREITETVLEAVGYADLLTGTIVLHDALEVSLASRDALAATVARVEALADELDEIAADFQKYPDQRNQGIAEAWRVAGKRLRAALHPEKGTDDE